MAAQKQFAQPWNVLEIETLLNDIASAIGDSTLTATLEEIHTMIASLSGGVHLRGAVNYYSDLPNDPEEGDAYTVLYTGESGTERSGIEYAWANYNSTFQWVPIGVDPSVYAKADLSNVPSASTSAKGVVQLVDSTSSTATDKAATPNSVKQAYDLANSKQDAINDLASIRTGATAGSTALQASDVSSTYSPSGTSPVNGTAVSEAVTPLETELGVIANNGAKNIVNNTADASQVVSGVTWVKNPDGSMIASGTSTGVSAVRVMGVQGSSTYASAVPIPKGRYIVSPSGFEDETYRIAVGIFESSETTRKTTNVYNTPYTFEIAGDNARIDLSCVISRSGETVTAHVFRPMIRREEISDDTFVPYAPTNRELYEMILALQQNGGA